MNSNYKDTFSNWSGNYFDITTDYIKDNQDDKAHLWSILLSYLHQKNGLVESEIPYVSASNKIFPVVNNFADFNSSSFNALIDSLVAGLTSTDWIYQENPHWNESWNEILLTFIKGINPETSAIYENSFDLYVDELGNLAVPESIRGGITNSGAAPMRVKDIKEADAGANFCLVSELYSKTDAIKDIQSDINITYEFKNMDQVQRYIDDLNEIEELTQDIAKIDAEYASEYAAYEQIYNKHQRGIGRWLPYNDPRIGEVTCNVNMDERQIYMEDGYIETVLGCYDDPYFIGDRMGVIVWAYSLLVQQPDEDVPRKITVTEAQEYMEDILNNQINWEEMYDEQHRLNMTDIIDFIKEYDKNHLSIMAWYGINVSNNDEQITDAQAQQLLETSGTIDLSKYLHYIGKYGSLQILEREKADDEARIEELTAEIAQLKQTYFNDCNDVVLEFKKYQDGVDSYFKYTITIEDFHLIYLKNIYDQLFDVVVNNNYMDFLTLKYCSEEQYLALKDIFSQIDNRYSIFVHCVKEPNTYYKLISPWVIPWYNINGHSYSTVRGADKIISALANDAQLQFTSTQEADWIRLIMPENLRRVEIEDLNRNFWVIGQVVSAISAFLFDPNGPIPKALRGMTQEIIDMWENTEYLWGTIAALGQEPYITEVKTMVIPLTVSELQPYLKYDNFDNLGSSSSLTDFRNACEARLNYLRSQYPNKHLVILPEIRLNNYEKNYYSRVFYPGIMKLDRNETAFNPIPWIWQSFSGSNASYDVDLTDVAVASHKSHTYGLRESSEETYNYYAPLSKSVSEVEKVRYYELLRPSYNLTGTYSNDTLSGTASITYWDAARYVALGSSQKIWEDGQWINPTINDIDITTIPIARGYYQGELLSTYKDSEPIGT